MRITKTKTLEIIGKGETLLLTCLNHPQISKPNWVGLEEFCAEMRTLVAEVKEQVCLVRAGRIPQAQAQKYRSRFVRHREIFRAVKMSPLLSHDYTSVVLPIVGADDTETARMAVLFELLRDFIECKETDYLRTCEVCQRWYIATKSDQKACSENCRKKKYRNTPEQNKRRRDNYKWNKKLKNRGKKR